MLLALDGSAALQNNQHVRHFSSREQSDFAHKAPFTDVDFRQESDVISRDLSRVTFYCHNNDKISAARGFGRKTEHASKETNSATGTTAVFLYIPRNRASLVPAHVQVEIATQEEWSSFLGLNGLGGNPELLPSSFTHELLPACSRGRVL